MSNVRGRRYVFCSWMRMVDAEKFQILRADIADDREKFLRSNFVSGSAGQRVLREENSRDDSVAPGEQATAFVDRINAR